MKIEAEVQFAFTSSGCSVSEGEASAQAAPASIGRPNGGCGSPPESNNISLSVFDCEHFQFIDDEDEETLDNDVVTNGTDQKVSLHTMLSDMSQCVKAGVDGDGPVKLKSLLKRGPHQRSNKKGGRVTFDEAVTLYSDENDGVRLLALTTGADLLCNDVYYMYDPPAEYQDIPPFEPPAEYRDNNCVHEVVLEPVSVEIQQKLETVDEFTGCKVGDNSISTYSENGVSISIPETTKETEHGVTEESEMKDHAQNVSVGEIVKEKPEIISESSTDSDKLFERFLEVEKEFAVDEELNSVFQELGSEFAQIDSQNGALDDNFFRKLITLLSSAEGDTTPVDDGDFFSSAKFPNDAFQELEDDENSQTHSRTLSEADSDCSISSQDTIIVRLEEDSEHNNYDNKLKPESNSNVVVPANSKLSNIVNESCTIQTQESFEEVFNENSIPVSNSDDKLKILPRESLISKNVQAAKLDSSTEESLSRQSSGEQSVNSGNSQESQGGIPQADADDSTSSDSRSGEVEEEIRLDDIGYDEEDADDYDEESFRGIAHGNSKIRRIIKKNALQCTIFRGIEAKRRQQPGAKYPRPKSPLLSQESLVEKLKWLTTMEDQHKEQDRMMNFHSKPPDVILSTGCVSVNGTIPNNMHNPNTMSYQQQQYYQMQRYQMPSNSPAGYYAREGYHPSLPRQRMACAGHPSQMMTHTLPYPPDRMTNHPQNNQVQWTDQRNMTVPRNFRDWRVIQRVMVSRNGDNKIRSPVPVDFVRCANGNPAYGATLSTDVSRTAPTRGNKDELEQFVEQDSKRLERIRKRYSVAEEDDDPTFGFARRPSVKSIQQSHPSLPDASQGHTTNKSYIIYEESGQGPPINPTRAVQFTPEQMRAWNPNWRPENGLYSGQVSQRPMHMHRASVALTELPGSATIPYTHRKQLPDTRYHSYAESMYGSTRTLPSQPGWVDPRSSHNPQMLQVPSVANDERGVPEGATSSPKISSDSMYHSSDQRTPHKDEGVIYYSLNV